jgi:glycosyltransferase involved in cell wall biosynthesis
MSEPSLGGQNRRTTLLLVNSTLHIGGAEQVSACLAEHLDPRVLEVSAVYLKEPGLIAEQMLRAGVDLAPLPGLRAGHRDYLTSLKLRRLINDRRVDIIHTHDLHGLVDAAICRATMPRLRHVHTFHFGNYPYRIAKHKIIESSLWRMADALIAVGHAQAATIRSLYGIPEHRLRVIWNGVEDPTLTAAPKFDTGVSPGTPIIASISTLIPQKGLHDLLDAAALLRQGGERFVLLIAGDGGLKNELHQRCVGLGLADHVRMLGWVPQAAQKLLPACDIFVQSSHWEAMSVVVLEAMAAARPMVVTAVGDNPHVVVDQGTGFIVPPSDPPALAAALRRLLREPELRARFGSAARSRYSELFTVERMIAKHQDLYRELTSSVSLNMAPVGRT